MAINFAITGDNSNLMHALDEARNGVNQAKTDIEKSGLGMEDVFKRVGAAAGVAFGVAQVKNFMSTVIDLRGEMQKLEISFNTLLGSPVKGSAMLNEMRDFAVNTPMMLGDLAKGGQTMLAFGIEAEKVMPILRSIGDISMGDAQRFNSLALAFSQASATGKLMGQDFLQMVNAGFNPLEQMAKTTGKSISELKDDMSNGAISADMLRQAFIDATGEGGKFHGMLENMSKGSAGAISNLEGAIQDMYNGIGQMTDGLTVSAANAATVIVKHYEDIGRVLGVLVATYGTYRAALMTTIALQNLQAAGVGALTAKEMIHYSWLVLQEKAQALLNKTMLANPYALAAAAIAGLVSYLVSMKDETDNTAQAQQNLADSTTELNKTYEDEKFKIDELFDALKNSKEGTEEYKEAKDAILNQYGRYLAKLGDEKHALDNIALAYKTVTEEAWKAAKARMKANLWEKEGSSRMDRERDDRSELLKSVKEFYKNKPSGYAEKQYMAIIKRIETGNDTSGGQWVMELSKLNNDIATNVNNLLKSKEQYNESIALYNTMYGDVEEEQQEAVITGQRRNKKFWEDLKKAKQEEWDAMTKTQRESAKGVKLRAEIENAEKQIAGWSINGKGGRSSGGSSGKSADNERKRAKEQLVKDLEKIEQQHADNEISIKEESTEKKIAQVKNEYAKTIAEINRQERELKDNNKKAGTTGLNSNGLTERQSKALEALKNDADKVQEKQTQELYKNEAQAMRDYLKEYGTYEQQKLAITEEYAEKIRKAETKGEKLTLQKERDAALRDKSDARVISKVDWASAFGNLGSAFEEIIKNTLDEVNDYMQTDEFKNRSVEDKQSIIEARNKLQGQTANDATFANLNKQLEDYRNKVAQMSVVEEYHKTAVEMLTQAEKKRDSIADKNSEDYAKACQDVELAQTAVESSAKDVAEASDSVAEAQHNVSETASQLQTNLDNFSNGLNQLTSGTLSGTLDGLDSLIKSLGGSGKAIDDFKKLLKTGLSAVFGDQLGGMLAESLDIVQGFLTGDLSEQIISGVLGMVDSILEGILKGGFITKPVNALIGGLRSIGNTLTFGGLNSWFDTSNAKEVQETIDRLTERNEILIDSIDRLTDELSNTSGIKAVETAKKAEELQREKEQNLLEIMQAQMGYHNAHHSWNYYWGGFSQDQIDKFSKQIGRAWDGTIESLTADEASKLLSNPDMVEAIKNTGKAYGSSVLEKLKDYADEAGALQEITDKLKESLTQITFDGLRSDFVSELMDMEKDTEDFSKDLTKKLMQGVLNAKIADLMDEDLQKFYDEWAERSKKEGGLTNSDIEALKAQWDGIVQTGIAIRDEAAKITGYDKLGEDDERREASKKGIATASQDSIDEVNGKLTSVQLDAHNIYEQIVIMAALQVEGNKYLKDVSDQIEVSNRYLADISANTSRIYQDFIERLNNLPYINNTLNDIAVKGVKML